MYIYTNILYNIETVVGQKKLKKNWHRIEFRVQRKSFGWPFWARVP